MVRSSAVVRTGTISVEFKTTYLRTGNRILVRPILSLCPSPEGFEMIAEGLEREIRQLCHKYDLREATLVLHPTGHGWRADRMVANSFRDRKKITKLKVVPDRYSCCHIQ